MSLGKVRQGVAADVRRLPEWIISFIFCLSHSPSPHPRLSWASQGSSGHDSSSGRLGGSIYISI